MEGSQKCWSCGQPVGDGDQACPHCFAPLTDHIAVLKSNQRRTRLLVTLGAVCTTIFGAFVVYGLSGPTQSYELQDRRQIAASPQPIKSRNNSNPRIGLNDPVLNRVGTPPITVTPKKMLSDDEIMEQIIEDSRKGYRGNCACPYDTASNGSRCGKRSAYSRPSGAYVICYKNQISEEMVAKFR